MIHWTSRIPLISTNDIVECYEYQLQQCWFDAANAHPIWKQKHTRWSPSIFPFYLFRYTVGNAEAKNCSPLRSHVPSMLVWCLRFVPCCQNSSSLFFHIWESWCVQEYHPSLLVTFCIDRLRLDQNSSPCICLRERETNSQPDRWITSLFTWMTSTDYKEKNSDAMGELKNRMSLM